MLSSNTGLVAVYIDGSAAGTTVSNRSDVVHRGMLCGLDTDNPVQRHEALETCRMVWTINGLGRARTNTITVQIEADRGNQ